MKTVDQVVEQRAHKAAAYLNTSLGVEKVVAFDPMLIVALIGVIIQVVKMMGWCGLSPDKAMKALAKPGVLGRMVLRRAVNKKLPDATQKFKKLVQDALVATSADVSEDEVVRLMTHFNPEEV